MRETKKRTTPATPKDKPIELIAILSDLHSGSVMALMPPEFTTMEGVEVRPNAFQQWLWRCWLDANQFIADVAGDDPFALVLNGDLIDGNHHRTTQIISPDVGDHVAMAKQLLSPLAEKAEKRFFIKGTECHTHSAEASIARELGGEYSLETGQVTFERLTIDIKGVRCVFRHHVGTSSRPWLSSTALGAELASEQLQAARNGEKIPHVLCCAHRHDPHMVTTTRETCLVTGPWQGLTRHAHKVVGAARTRPNVFLLDWRGKGHGEQPKVHHRTYSQPQPQAIKL
jgi:hypothetical protein